MKKLLIPAVVLVFTCFSCGDQIEELKESITSAEDYALAETQLSGIFDVVDDVSSSDGRLNKTSGTLLPSGAILEFTDSLWDDGDGKEFYVDFGPRGSLAPFGMLCQDGKYRAGRLNLKLNKPYTQIGAQLEIMLSGADSFFSGNGTDMYQITGNKKITRTAVNKLDIQVQNMEIRDLANVIRWNSNGQIERTVDAGPGIWMDHFEITGGGNGQNRNGEDFTVNIDQPLLKKIESGCAKTFVKGVITLTVTGSGKKIMVDYDPYDNEACDNLAEADINGKKTIFRVK